MPKRWVLAWTALLLFLLAGRVVPAAPLHEGPGLSQAVFDRRHELLRLTLAPDEKYRLWVPLEQVHPALVEATLLQEDQHFYRHPGFNPVALARGAFTTYLSRERRMGGSTITMQLARMVWDIDSRRPLGKGLQILRAMQLEWRYSKHDILEAYLNLAPYGRNVEGVGAASLVYFGKDASRLALADALTLAVLPQSPRKRDPARNAQALAEARVRLFDRWVARHPRHAELRSAIAAPLPVRSPSELPFLAPHFVDSLVPRLPASAQVVTTLDLQLQRLLERQVARYVERRRAVGIRNAAVLLADWRTSEVVALVGSAGFHDVSIQGQVNGTTAKRSPGSALKPFVYALAFDQGLIHPLSVIKDAPASFSGYNPENFDGDFAGPISARDALARSRNIPAVELAARLSDPTFHGFLRRAGVSRLRSEENYGLSLVLGAAEVSMEELAELYAMLARGGELRRLRQLPGDDGFVSGDPQLLSPEASFMTLDSLEGRRVGPPAVRSSYVRDPIQVSWKTGTSHAHRDAWAVGVLGPYVLAVWVGNFNGSANRAFTGVEAAGPLMFDVIEALRLEHPEISLVRRRRPAGLSRVEVCPVSGMLPSPHCPHRIHTWFIPGKSPVKACDVHREVLVDIRTGKRACRPSELTRAEVYEFWPSDLLRLFQKAGVPRRVPPPESAECGLEAMARSGLPPTITSPVVGVDYAVRASSSAPEHQTIPLLATADADAREMFWFVDERLVGKSRPGEALPWAARPGRYLVRAVDDHGRADARELRVRAVP
ncbi:MAG TPA: penicillin-binding protein 1C [Myxococcales bacterium]|nr:penicillin-binding protein 1C [Myxococcales bacterium]